ncbi:Bifunctional L-3-cyanoalanine synthase/cysteine synthase [Seminavis robusta]|uniref:Cysteine synthase n=1 Tax=Seminavis robusta TaxID=568900 RepID=A0A9N8E1H9_9STRA|nr:Bifunctional L-3-cyanoalanine synthase/cysteine synthase [Seminavis robusta]|eukprot:Sro554_g165550.1 Bifunctional L-3-cyanoalanine synthase/cysteine synthase (389) ;mRNA; r:39013-40179
MLLKAFASSSRRHVLSSCTQKTWSVTSVAVRSLNVASRPSELIGNTPLLDLQPLLDQHGVDNGSKLYGKLESLGPCSSVKDRLGRSMIDDAEARGILKKGESVLVEPTSGNTGIALAFIARERGYRCILTMPETMSVERRMMLLALGCEVVLTPKETAVPGALAKAHEILEQLDGKGIMLQQFENPANPKIHRETTGPEIWRDTDGQLDIFVSGVGTGGTVTGVSQYIKGSPEHDCPPLQPNLMTVAVEPMEQMLLTAAKGGDKIGPQGPHKIQGMGAGLVPKVLDLSLIDEVVPIHSDNAMSVTHDLWMTGLPVGVSSGAIVAASLEVLQRPESANKTAVCIIPSFGERYFTHPMFASTKEAAEALVKQPLPEPFDNTEYGFATPRG